MGNVAANGSTSRLALTILGIGASAVLTLSLVAWANAGERIAVETAERQNNQAELRACVTEHGTAIAWIRGNIDARLRNIEASIDEIKKRLPGP